MKRVLSIALLSTFLISGFASGASAASGYYLGFNILGSMVGGDFDGGLAPEIDPGAGLGLVLGYGLTPFFAMELNANSAVHDIKVAPGAQAVEATQSSLTFSFKVNIYPDHPTQPFIRMGGGFYMLALDDPVYTSHQKWTGLGGEIEIGVDFYIFPNFSIGTGLTQRLIKYDKFAQFGVSTPIEPALVGDTTSATVNFVYHLGPGYGDWGGF